MAQQVLGPGCVSRHFCSNDNLAQAVHTCLPLSQSSISGTALKLQQMKRSSGS